jgi:hypothetical protein
VITRGGYNWTDRYPWIVGAALAARKVRQKRFVLDGEAVILGVDGVSDFNALHSRKHDHEVQFCAFDILVEGDDDLRKPLHRRKMNLQRLLARRPEGVFVSEFGRARSAPIYSGRPAGWAWRHRLEAPRAAASRRQVPALGQGEEQDPSDDGARDGCVQMRRPHNITFAEMHAAGVRKVLIYGTDHKCSHHTTVTDDADRWPDEPHLRCRAQIRLHCLRPAWRRHSAGLDNGAALLTIS